MACYVCRFDIVFVKLKKCLHTDIPMIGCSVWSGRYFTVCIVNTRMHASLHICTHKKSNIISQAAKATSKMWTTTMEIIVNEQNSIAVVSLIIMNSSHWKVCVCVFFFLFVTFFSFYSCDNAILFSSSIKYGQEKNRTHKISRIEKKRKKRLKKSERQRPWQANTIQ